MPTYVFRGKNLVTNQIVTGERFAPNKMALETALKNEQIIPLSIQEKGKEIVLPTVKKKVKDRDLALFTRQFSVMIESGLPLVQCLKILAMQQQKKSFQAILLNVQKDVESGMSLADAMEKHPHVFDSLYVNMIRAGEAGGILDVILKRLSAYMEKMVKLKSSIKSALIYPAVVISVAITAVFILLWKVIPTFASLFEGLGADLPVPTKIVIAVSKFLQHFGLLIVILVALGIYGVKKWYQTENGKKVLDNLMLKIPVIGMLIAKITIARITKTLSTLVSSGIAILDALEITAKAAGNVIFEETVMKIRSEIEKGRDMATPMEESGMFPTMVIQMVRVGEQTGELDAMLERVSQFYEDEVDRAVANLMSLLEPLLLVFLGVTIGSIVVAMYMPMFSLIAKLSKSGIH